MYMSRIRKMLLYQPRKRKYKVVYGVVWFLVIYLMLLYCGERIMFLADTKDEPRETWTRYTVVGLIILGSSGLTKMLLGWVKEMRKDKSDGNQ
jgi:hypothetical protein